MKKKGRLLIADDDRLILATVAEGFREAGYDVEQASNGQEAVEKAKNDSPDLAILDVRMPKMSGIEAAGELAQLGIPFVFLSAYDDTDIVSQAVEYGALGYLVKPIDVQKMLPSVETALTRARERHNLHKRESHLTHALESDRSVSIAIGLMMERHKVTEQAAFESLRKQARSHQRKLKDLAKDMVKSANTLNQFQSS